MGGFNIAASILLLGIFGTISKCNPELEYIFQWNNRIYLISSEATDVHTASQRCEEEGYELLSINSEAENEALKTYFLDQGESDIWTNGQITQVHEGDNVTYHMTWVNSGDAIDYTDFAKPPKHAKKEPPILPEWQADQGMCVSSSGGSNCIGDLCGPPCGTIPRCNITLPKCTTITPPCTISVPKCDVIRGNCSVSCPPCEVVSPECIVTQGECHVINGRCYSQPPSCRIIYQPPCVTIRPNCTTLEKPCKSRMVEIPCPVSPKCTFLEPCVTTQEPCYTVPGGTCVTSHAACVPQYDWYGNYVGQDCGHRTTTCPPPVTICPSPRTKCKPPIDCQPLVCQKPALICEEPETYCPNPITKCPPPEIECGLPKVHCDEATVVCPDPVITCTQPQAICPGPNVTCPGFISHCSDPPPQCPPPQVYCPPPIIHCEPPIPCTTPKTPPLTNPTCPPGFTDCCSSTTPMPYPGNYGRWRRSVDNGEVEDGVTILTKCIGLRKKHGYKWDHKDCSTPRRFVCETTET